MARVSPMAFDGKVVSIAPAEKAGGEDDHVYAFVTFAVSEWFAGGQGDTAIVEVLRPDLDLAETAKLEPFAVGDRLLISGGLPDDASKTSVPVAAGCDFSRFYDGATATLWRDAFR
ncbi:hypothetical protein H9L21_15055 [Aeromicrobium senzhongii]|uniref:Uncharacterized protein n=1 Tax=Aeromicrobium senzhongii TaxID=2663859 RepID=A0ABX6SSZ0_9ACTN|nr:hypothetical protein [Aeromicrobium senzhongii]MTB89494.1 hypothetical protein [Aeromicrobium senzhongii]QNL94372.1 hypothetical protein H9L21_15055 [Aeromicrobium senzhongii]